MAPTRLGQRCQRVYRERSQSWRRHAEDRHSQTRKRTMKLNPKRVAFVALLGWLWIGGNWVLPAQEPAAEIDASARRSTFNTHWRFAKLDPEGAEQPTFDDREWRELELPHD